MLGFVGTVVVAVMAVCAGGLFLLAASLWVSTGRSWWKRRKARCLSWTQPRRRPDVEALLSGGAMAREFPRTNLRALRELRPAMR